MTSSGTVSLLPPVKSVVVYRNGDPFFSGRRFVVSQKHVATMETFLNDVTLSIQAPLAVRTLYTPRHGHRVGDLQELQSGSRYVAAGFERFKKLDYLNTGIRRGPACRGEAAQVRPLNRPNVSAKWRKGLAQPCIFHVFRNGDILSPALRFIITRSMQRNLEQILSLVSEKACLRTGAVRRLCTLDGVTVTCGDELETAQYFVAVGTERFKKLPYVELMVTKACGGSADRHYTTERRLQRRYENRKALPLDAHSDLALLLSPETDGRRVKSTGDEAEGGCPPQAGQTGPGKSGKKENSIFYAKPVRVHKNGPTPRALHRAAAQPSVFKGNGSKGREEVQGAEEVQEDESTAVELPVDQRAAETVEDEAVHGREEMDTEHKEQRRSKTLEDSLPADNDSHEMEPEDQRVEDEEAEEKRPECEDEEVEEKGPECEDEAQRFPEQGSRSSEEDSAQSPRGSQQDESSESAEDPQQDGSPGEPDSERTTQHSPLKNLTEPPASYGPATTPAQREREP